MKFFPHLDNGGRWHHIASEKELMGAMRNGRHKVYEVPMLCMTFIVVRNRLTIVRCGGTMGGDTRDIEGGWVYLNEIDLLLDEREIGILAEHPANSAFA